MKEIYFNGNINTETLNEIKYLSLYYEKINVVNDAVYTIGYNEETDDFISIEHSFIPESFYNDYDFLIQEKIIELTSLEDEHDEYEKIFPSRISSILNRNKEYIFPNSSSEGPPIITKEIRTVFDCLAEKNSSQAISIEKIWWYYALKLKWLIQHTINGHRCLTNSSNLNHLFIQFAKEINKDLPENINHNVSPSLGIEAIKIFLPNPEILSFEQILDLKSKLSDELENFSYNIQLIENQNPELLLGNISQDKYKLLFYENISKPIKEIETKIKSLKSKSFRSFIEKLKDPKSYAPLIGSIAINVPIEFTLLTTLGLNSGITYLEYIEEKRKIRDHPLYFLLKIRK